MQKIINENSLNKDSPKEELIDTLMAISIVSKRIATKIRKNNEKGEKSYETQGRNFKTT